MESPLTLSPWTHATARRWICERVDRVSRVRALAAFEAVTRRLASGAPGVAIAHEDNAEYAGAWLAAASLGAPVWCANPKWGEAERAEARALIPSGVVWVSAGEPDGDARPAGARVVIPGACAAIFIPTGGTGGRVRFVRHSPVTLSASVSGFLIYARRRLAPGGGPLRLHAVQALPCCHVSGLMPVVRAWLTGGELVFANPSFRPEDPLPEVPATDDGLTVVSSVNAQLHRLLERADGPAWLREAGLVLVGGSAVSPELLERARGEKIPLGVSYGLTEVAALAALYPPEAFLRGEPVAGEILPHLRAEITSRGRIAFSGASVPRELIDADGRYVTGDEGFLDTSGRLVVTGRADRILVSGGEKIDPTEIEAAIRATGLVREVVVGGEPDAEWGTRLVAVYYGEIAPEALAEALSGTLRHHRRPRRWVRSSESLFDEKGKVRAHA